MNNQNRKEFAQLCALLSQAFDKSMSEMLIDIYFDGLKDFDIEAVASAVRQAVKSKTFMPKVAELRELIEGSAQDKAEAAWRTFLELVRFEGEYPSLQVYDGGMAFAIEQFGGWVAGCAKICAASPEMVANYEKTFKASYKLGVQRAAEAQYFTGRDEQSNRGLGAWKSPTVNLKVCLVKPGSIVPTEMPFDIAQGRLTDDARKALQAGTGPQLAKYLPPRLEPVKSLPPAPDEEMATPEEVAELKAEIGKIASSQRNGLTLVKTPNNGGTTCK